MNSSAVSWLSEMGLDNPNFTAQFDFTDSFDEELAAMLGQEIEACLSPEESLSPSSTFINIPSSNSIVSLSNSPEKSPEPPHKMQKSNSFSNFPRTSDPTAASTPIILNFGNANSPENPQQGNTRSLNVDEEIVVSEILKSQDSEDRSKRVQNTKKPSRVRPPSQIYDHIVAERKRREQLSQRFLTLSTIVPGLKKRDKTSVLGDAIKYLLFLKERVQVLEEQAKEKTMESVVLVKKSQMMVEDEDSSDDKNPNEEPLPEIEARICNTQILIRVHCEKQRGILAKLISKVEKLNLRIVNSNVALFGSLALDITLITEMDKEFNLTVNEVVRKLHAALQSTCCSSIYRMKV